MRYVILGTGNISNTYVRALQVLEGSTLVGCVSRSGKTLQANLQLPVWSALDDVDCECEAVIVATPNGEHHKGVIAAAKLGKHVITEKPLDISLENADAAIDACKKAGVTLAVAYQHRVAQDNLGIKKLLDAKAFGKVFAVDLAAKFYRPQSYYDSGAYRGGYAIDGGGPFMQQASHNLDIYCWFFGMPEKVVSMMDTFNHTMEAEDHGAALMRHANGMLATVIASTIAEPGFAARMEVHTEKGSFTLTDHAISQWYIHGLDNPADRKRDYKSEGAASAVVTDTSAHQKIVRNFEEAVLTGGKPVADGESARMTTELILKIYNAKI